MEEQDQKMKHVCKWCNKRYPCGRSLGGHMRSHIIANSAEAEEEANPNLDKSSPLSKRDHSGVVANEQSGYGLRQNPRKTWRLVDSSSGLENGMLYCKECGKGFQSLKALCGHMACHSEKERPMNNIEDHSWTNIDREVVMDSQSDTETAAPRRQRRSRRTRYKTLDVNSFSLGNASSSVSETEQEQEEVAMCLMMLSKDSGNWGDFNSVAESSDNNYRVLETGSLSIDMRIAKKGLNSVYNVDEKKKPGGKKLKSGAFDAEVVHFGKFSDSGHFRNGGRKLNSSAFDPEAVHFENSDSGFFRNGAKNLVHFENSDSGFFGNGAKNLKFGTFDDEGFHCVNSDSGYIRNGAKKVESDGSFDSILRKGEFMKHKGEGGSGFGVFDAEFGKRDVRRLNCTKTELLKNLIKEEGYNHADRALVRHDSRKLWEASYKNSQKRGKFECLTCNKVFKSHQALGGHIASHRKANGSVASTYESGENSMETDIYSDQMLDSKLIDNCSGKNLINQNFSGNAERKSVSKKRKGHKCPICFKVFRSGQALGGHKRSHLAGGSDDKSNQAAVIKRDPPEILFDLNLPAPIEAEANEHASFVPCCKIVQTSWWMSFGFPFCPDSRMFYRGNYSYEL